MGKQKDFRHVHHSSHKKKDKKFDKTVKPSRSNCQESYLKNVEVVVQAELEAAATAKKIGRKMRKDLDRYPLLAKAAFLGCERVVDSILEAGENVNIQVPDGSTPLILAVENGYQGIVQKLLKKGADPKLLRQDGRNALMIAVAKNDNRSFTMIWNYWDKSNFWELNHTDSQGYTALTIAVELGNSQLTNFFLSLNGIELDKQTVEGKTALMFAVAGGQVNVVQKLLSSGSDFVLEDKNGATAICLAISLNQHEIKEIFYECLDSKSRDIYVKKRIELLTRPRVEEITLVTAFYKDILFRVILEIKRSFEDGVVLLQRHRVFFGLYKCLDTHQQDTDLLRTGFHLTACLMYDKAEYSRYIVEELAEQYISTKFTDFTLMIMQKHRMKSMTDLRGAAFLCIHAGTQCRSGKTWLKTNYFRLLPFVKEFKVILSTLTFWAEGESTKAKIMFDRFTEIFSAVGKDLKISTSPETKKTVTDPCTSPKMADKSAVASTSKRNISSHSIGDDWQVVSKAGPKKDPKVVGKQSASSTAVKRDNKKRNKTLKLKTKLQNKMTAKKLSQRPNLKYFDLEKYFPSSSSGGKFTQACYADVLKKNLKNKDIPNKAESDAHISEGISDYSSNNNASSKPYSLSEIELDYDIERKKLNTKKQRNAEQINMNLKSEDGCNLKSRKQQSEGNFYDHWKHSCESKYPTDLMTFITNLFTSNEKKKQISNQNVQNKTLETAPVTSCETATKDGHKRQSKALRDILKALGLKTDCEQDEIDESKDVIKVETKNATKSNSECAMKTESKNAINIEFLYSDCFKTTSSNESKNKAIVENKSTTDTDQSLNSKAIALPVKRKVKNTEDLKETVTAKVSVDSNLESTLGIKSENIEKNDKLIDATSVEDVINYKDKYTEAQSSDKNEIQGNIENVKEKSISKSLNGDFDVKSVSKYCNKTFKRKNPDICYRDLSFNIYKEEIKEVNDGPSLNLFLNLGHRVNLSGHLMQRSKMDTFLNRYFDESEYRTLQRLSANSSENESNLNAVVNMLDNLVLNEEYSEPIKGENSEYFNTTSGTIQDNRVRNVGEFDEEEFDTLSTLKRNRASDSKNIFGESKNVLRLVIRGNFSTFDLDFQERNKHPKNFTVQFSVTSVKSPVIRDITLSNIQKFLFLFKRLILYQVADQPHLSLMYMNTRSRLALLNLKCPFVVDSVSNNASQKKDDCCLKENTEEKSDIKLSAFREEYKMLMDFKSEVDTILSYLAKKSLQSKQKQPKNFKKKRTIDTKSFNKTKQTRENFKHSVQTVSIEPSFTFSSEVYGYKPGFIYCERRSRWFEKLHRIESCVPLAAFAFGFGQVERSKSTLHELISSTGKVVFSSSAEHILRRGDFGTYIGLMSNVSPVAVKIFPRTQTHIIEMFSNKRYLNHQNLVQFYCVCNPPHDHRIFSVSELVEYSLPEYLKTKMIHSDKSHLIRDLVEAIQYLHGKRIVHGFLKPSNVMVTIDDRLKVSDFFQMGVTPVVFGIVNDSIKKKPAPIGTSAISDICWRPYELITATAEKDVRALLTKASDIQMTGMLIYYILSEGKHPFGTSDLRCQENIRDGFPEFGPRPSDIESRDLVRDMIKRVPSKRLTVQQVARHPYFWNIIHRVQFLVDVTRKIEFYTRKPTKVAEALQDSCIEARDWTSYIQPELLKFVSKWMHKIYVDDYANLLHFIWSINDNFEIMPQEVKSYMGHPSFFISRTFPTFFMSVYCVVRDNPFVQQQMALQAYF